MVALWEWQTVGMRDDERSYNRIYNVKNVSGELDDGLRHDLT